MSLFETVVLPNVMEIIPPDNNGALHLHFSHDAGKDATTDGHISGEGAFLINIRPFDGL